MSHTSIFTYPVVRLSRLDCTGNVYERTQSNNCFMFLLQVILRSMHKYLPVLKIRRLGDRPAERCFTFAETEFIAVTAYQVSF